jgi:hypothetical protein
MGHCNKCGKRIRKNNACKLCKCKSGPTGNTGDIGETGDQGPTGNSGPTGPCCLGSTGNQGPTGVNGIDGFTGNQGSTGVNGTNGLTGDQGPTGAFGPTGVGFTGIEGTRGSQGPTGENGPTGPCCDNEIQELFFSASPVSLTNASNRINPKIVTSPTFNFFIGQGLSSDPIVGDPTVTDLFNNFMSVAYVLSEDIIIRRLSSSYKLVHSEGLTAEGRSESYTVKYQLYKSSPNLLYTTLDDEVINTTLTINININSMSLIDNVSSDIFYFINSSQQNKPINFYAENTDNISLNKGDLVAIRVTVTSNTNGEAFTIKFAPSASIGNQ